MFFIHVLFVEVSLDRRWGRDRGMTCSKGPQGRIKPRAAAARTQLCTLGTALYIGHHGCVTDTASQLSQSISLDELLIYVCFSTAVTPTAHLQHLEETGEASSSNTQKLEAYK